MRRRMQWPAAIAFETLIAMGAGLFPAGAGGGMTTGDLAQQLARAAGITLPVADTQRVAMLSLHEAGGECPRRD